MWLAFILSHVRFSSACLVLQQRDNNTFWHEKAKWLCRFVRKKNIPGPISVQIKTLKYFIRDEKRNVLVLHFAMKISILPLPNLTTGGRGSCLRNSYISRICDAILFPKTWMQGNPCWIFLLLACYLCVVHLISQPWHDRLCKGKLSKWKGGACMIDLPQLHVDSGHTC